MARKKEFDEQKVIDQLVQLYRVRGYQATSIRDVVAHLGISSSSLYATFGDKDALFMLALRRNSELETAHFREFLADDGEPHLVMQRLYAESIDKMLADEVPHGSLTLKAAVELGVGHPKITQFLVEYFENITAQLADYLQEAADNGQLHLQEPATAVARYLIAGLFNLGFMARVGSGRRQLESYARLTLSVLDTSVAVDW